MYQCSEQFCTNKTLQNMPNEIALYGLTENDESKSPYTEHRPF